MEDSLKRLKKARGTGVSIGTQGMSDDDKIRQQLIIDIEYYGQQVSIFVRIYTSFQYTLNHLPYCSWIH